MKKIRLSPYKKLAGISVVEMLIGVALITVISIILISVFLAQTRFFDSQETAQYVASQNRIALDEMTRQIRESASVATVCFTCSPVEWTGDTILVLELWPLINGVPTDPNASGYIFDYVIYKQGSPLVNLVKKIDADPASDRAPNSEKIIATNVTDIKFYCDDGVLLLLCGDPGVTHSAVKSVNIELKNEESSLSDTKPHEFFQESSATIRNKQ